MNTRSAIDAYTPAADDPARCGTDPSGTHSEEGT
jgi:hypothetical protein